MNEAEILDELVPSFDAVGDWDDVLRRAARRRPSRRLLVAAVAVVAAFVVAPALAVLLRDRGLQLPSGADRRNVAVMINPVTGRVQLEVAPWKGHRGFCYLVPPARADCVPRTAGGATVLTPPLFGWTFDARVVSGEATTRAGKHIPLIVRRFKGRIDTTFFLVRGRLPVPLGDVVLKDSAGRTVIRVRR